VSGKPAEPAADAAHRTSLSPAHDKAVPEGKTAGSSPDAGGRGKAGKPGAGDGNPRNSGGVLPFGYSLTMVDTQPRVIRNAPVIYPKEARRQHISGHVLVRFHLDASGTVSHLHIKHAEPEGVFNESTLAAVRQWKFLPARSGGKAVSVWVELPVEFTLRN
jgi:protein TonB